MIIIRYCNYNYYQQKEFGLIDNYRKKKISKLKENISKDYNEILESNNNIAKLRKENVLKNEYKLIRKMKKVAKNEGRTKMVGDRRPGEVPQNVNINLGDKRGHYRNLIYYNPDNGAGGVAHEIGHSLERESGNRFGKYIDKVSDKIRRERYDEDNKNDDNPIKANVRSKVVLINEKRATKRGLKLLKDAGASSEVMENKKKELNESLRNHEAAERGNLRLRKLNKKLKKQNEPEESSIESVWRKEMARKRGENKKEK